ncbi:molybdopterin-dependent oxidoreductase [Arthrobacter psychrochitiniphilus]|uniref:Oxidoreductase n=1 Tax=Arthrobacter psychrochitiniphilus TaxID=291045 RepID=A0A2V3DSK3_9MICC|nr:molybdopterin-dependent oxidoreductase [Arthrobacter psychrochitiniphilus]NYG17204.1 DMSO/TMAO reductase YedYZ molybdopterin-dependent catalytic subunit/thiosulfate reductase cytochrome b subunit [Arthrobacter psychrochitiniphilus]PXA65508.1 oxidoreductase [Arthrobacter psychrochitiniphilus]
MARHPDDNLDPPSETSSVPAQGAHSQLPPVPATDEGPPTYKSFRSELTHKDDDVIDPEWAGSIPAQYGVAPRVRIGASKWFNLLWLIPIGFVVLVIGIAVAKGIRGLPGVAAFMAEYPGTSSLRADAPVGFPAWLGWQHFLNLFFMLFIIRSGWQILADHPRLYWTRHSTPGRGWFRMQKPVPTNPLYTAKEDSITLPAGVGLPGRRHTIGLARWWHLGIDTLWLLNGLIFYVLLFSTGQWLRLVPLHWDVIPNSISVVIQYLSLNWPVETGWTNYNSLQLIAYFLTVFIAAPLALITGLGMSPALSTKFRWISSIFSIQVARSLHFLVMCYFCLFIVIHVTLVLTTGALANLNHMYAAQESESWTGFWIFAASMVIVVVAWVAATPLTYRYPRKVQRVGYALIGPAQRLFEHIDSKPGQYTEKDISPYFWHNGKYPESQEYKDLRDGDFANYKLQVSGLVANPVHLDLMALRALPQHEQITQHFCIQGWSGVAKWGGVSLQTIMDLVKPAPAAKWVVFYSFAEGSDKGLYYDAQPIEQMHYELTMLAYDMNDQALSYGHGAPLRLRNEVQLGFKMVKWIKGIEFVEDFSEVGGGQGGYNNDHEFFGYSQSI